MQGPSAAGLLVAIVFAKILAFAVSVGSGFVGGPIFPALFIGGTTGVAVHQAFGSVPLGLAFTCMFAAVPGALVAAPFAMAMTAAFMTQVGALQTAPILIAVVTSFLAMEGVKYLTASRMEGAAQRSTVAELYVKMLTARAMTRPMTTSETVDCTAIADVAQGASGITSVGLNAVLLVKPR